MIIERLKYFFFNVHNDWQIGVIHSNLKKFIFSKDIPQINWVTCEFNVYQADPFGIEKGGNLHLYYEEFLKEKNYAVLKCMVLNTDLKKIHDQIILDDGTHKSFPFLFESDDNLYMMPESGALNRLEIFECTEFPFKWKQKHQILDFACSDAILQKIENTWFLFYTKSKIPDENKTLYLRKSENLFGDWNLQTETIVNDSNYSSRNAGSIYKLDEEYFRFAQNCSNSYGENVVIKKVNCFHFNDYSETVICEKHLPNNGNGFHTLNATDSFVLVDRRRYRYQLKSISLIFKQLKNSI